MLMRINYDYIFLLGHKNVDMTLNTYVLENCMKDELLNKLKKIENIK